MTGDKAQIKNSTYYDTSLRNGKKLTGWLLHSVRELEDVFNRHQRAGIHICFLCVTTNRYVGHISTWCIQNRSTSFWQ